MTCEICGGAGFLRRELPVSDPNYGKAIPCACKLREMSASLKKANHITESQAVWTLAKFPGDPNAKQKALEAVASRQGVWVFVSSFGRGKSGLLVAAVNALLQEGVPAMYKVVPLMLDELRSGYRNDTFMDTLNGLIDVPVLALDELHRAYDKGAGEDSEWGSRSWVQEKLFTLIDERYSDYTKKLTLIATNRQPDKGDVDAIWSRLGDTRRCHIVTVTGPDLRPQADYLEPQFQGGLE